MNTSSSSRGARAPSALYGAALGRLLLLAGTAGILASCGGGQPAVEVPTLSPEELAAQSEAFRDVSIDRLESDNEAMQLAGQLYAANCASCHENNPEAHGVADLRRGHFNFGTTADAIRTTIREGRTLTMPAVGGQFGETSLGQLVAFVQSLSKPPQASGMSSFEEGGKELFATHCAMCHGPDGKGNPGLGVPDLADDYWQYGGSMMNIRLGITRGIESQCPPHPSLSDPEVDLLTAYVLNLVAGNSPN